MIVLDPTRLRGLGRLGQTELVPRDQVISPVWVWTWRLLGVAGAGLGAYHGYKRHEGHHPGWYGFLWFIYGGLLPVLAIPVAFAQGYAKPRRRR